MLKESFVVVSGRHTYAQIEQALITHDSVVIMKAGQARTRILDVLTATGRSQDARYLEYIGRDNQKVIDNVKHLAYEAGPYFSLFVVLPSSRCDK
jgi:precorrin-2/cobalt-factor-2 C20-methyltransferase